MNTDSGWCQSSITAAFRAWRNVVTFDAAQNPSQQDDAIATLEVGFRIFDRRIQDALLVKGHNYEDLGDRERDFRKL